MLKEGQLSSLTAECGQNSCSSSTRAHQFKHGRDRNGATASCSNGHEALPHVRLTQACSAADRLRLLQLLRAQARISQHALGCLLAEPPGQALGLTEEAIAHTTGTVLVDSCRDWVVAAAQEVSNGVEDLERKLWTCHSCQNVDEITQAKRYLLEGI